MDLTLNTDQRDLQAGLRDILRKVWTPERLRACAESPVLDSFGWETLAETGVFGLLVREADGGMGLGIADATIVFEELGAALVPGPLVATLLAAGLIDGALAGRAVVTSVDTRDSVLVVEHLDAATDLIVVDDSGLFRLTPDQCSTTPVTRPLDPMTPMSSVVLPAELGTRIGSPADAAQWRKRGAVLTAALQVGLAQGALDLGVRYAKERVQFGRAIGSFQAVKHMLAESLVKVDLARAAVIVAALEVDDPGVADPGAAVSAAKVLADKAATDGGRCCVQVHGGMGFTWEVLAHLYLKRAWLLATTFGSADEHAMRLAALIGS